MVMIERALCPVLVGRNEELSILEDALLSANRGEGSVVALAGDAGLGKTRLATELERRARAVGMEVLSGGCSEADLSLPYLPLLEAIGNYVAGTDLEALRARLGPSARELSQLFPQLDPSVTPSEGVESTQAKLRLFEGMISLLAVPADVQGLLLIIEDLHWADASTRELLDYMTRRLRQLRIMVLATYRRDEMHRKHPLAPIVQAWRRSGSAKVVEIEPLRSDQIESMVRAIFDVDEVSVEFRDFLHDRSEGNPFVLEEMLKEAIDNGDVYRSETGEWERKDLAQLAIPQSVADSIMARVERMDPDHADVLRAAAVLGPTFEYDMLIALTGLTESVVQTALIACVQQQLIVPVERSPGTYRFRHALTREAVYEDLILPRRQQLHARAAEVLETKPKVRSVEIANHLLAAGKNEEAVPFCLSAADEAMDAVAYPEAIALYERVLTYISDPAQRGRVLTQLGHAFTISAEPGHAEPYLREAVDVFTQIGDPHEEAKARLWLGRAFWESQSPRNAQEEYEKARALLEAEGPSEDLANAYVRLSGLGVFDFDYERAVSFAEKGIEVAKKAGVDQPRVWAYNFLGIGQIYGGKETEGIANLERSYEEGVARGWYVIANNALHNLIATLDESLLRAKDCPALLEKLEALPATIWPEGLTFRKGQNAFQLGYIEEATNLLEESLSRTRQIGATTVAGWAEMWLAIALIERDELDRAASLLHVLDPQTERQELATEGMALLLHALATNDLERAVAAVRVLRPAISTNFGFPQPIVFMAESLVGAGDIDEAKEFIDGVLIPNETANRPIIDAARGSIAFGEGDTEGARTLFARSADGFTDAGYRVDAVRVRLHLVEALERLGDRGEAQMQLDEVIRVATECGALLRLRQAVELAERLGLDAKVAQVEEAGSGIESELIETGERFVTTMFADVRNYTTMTNERAPDDMVDRIASFYRWAKVEIEKRGGLIDKFAGDAVMATFNVSGRTTDHTVRALEAGIALQDKAAMMGLPVGVGLAVGSAIVGRFTDGANLSVLGETTNLAARLQAKAGAGEVALSYEAHRRTTDWLQSRGLVADQVSVELKGFDSPVNAFVVRARS